MDYTILIFVHNNSIIRYISGDKSYFVTRHAKVSSFDRDSKLYIFYDNTNPICLTLANSFATRHKQLNSDWIISPIFHSTNKMNKFKLAFIKDKTRIVDYLNWYRNLEIKYLGSIERYFLPYYNMNTVPEFILSKHFNPLILDICMKKLKWIKVYSKKKKQIDVYASSIAPIERVAVKWAEDKRYKSNAHNIAYLLNMLYEFSVDD